VLQLRLGRCCAQIPQEYYTSALGYGEEHLPMVTMLGNKSKMLDQKKKSKMRVPEPNLDAAK